MPKFEDDPDYFALKNFITANSCAPTYMIARLDDIMKRAGVRVPGSKELAGPKQPEPKLNIKAVKAYIALGKTQQEIAKLCECGIDRLRRFTREHDIKPSCNGCGKYMRVIKVESVRIDESLPVPVQVISHAYGAASTAHI